jgi:hypothetical protein
LRSHWRCQLRTADGKHYFQSGFHQVFRQHRNAHFAVGVEFQKPRFRERGNRRCAFDIHHDHCSARSTLLGEVDGLRFYLFQYFPDHLSDGAITHHGVERFVRDSYVEKHAHVILLLMPKRAS